MVSTKFESKLYKPWKPVARPVPKPNAASSGFLNRQAPPLPPKPGGKVFVYVYEAPKNSQLEPQVNVAGSGTLPPNTQLIVNGMPPATINGTYPQFLNLNEVEDDSNVVNKLRNRAKRSGKGYKLLADVAPRKLNSSSRGGQMFIKQKQRMDDYTSLATHGKVMSESEIEDTREERDPYNTTIIEVEKRSTPWNISKMSPAAVKYIPTSLYHNSLTKERKKVKGKVFPPLRSPPPEWREKVESDYRILYDNQTLPNRRWNTVDATHRSHSSRCESAPLPNIENSTSSIMEDERNYAGSAFGIRSESKNENSIVVVNFDARRHRRAPHRKQGARAGRGVFITTPHIQHDFNARAIGWSRAYAEQY